jgi:ferredoxin
MTVENEALFLAYLEQHDDEAWRAILDRLAPMIHEVDRNATLIWHFFFPPSLGQALSQASDLPTLARKLFLEGNYLLKTQVDSSHRFLYGHRYWPEVKRVVLDYISSANAPASLDLAVQIQEVAARAAERQRTDVSLLVGITAVAFMTLQQVGVAAFRSSPGTVTLSPRFHERSPEEIVRRRREPERHSLKEILSGKKTHTVIFDERLEDATFRVIHSQELTTGAYRDKPHYTWHDPRCKEGEGPIPVQCRSAACGTCWIGVLAGAENLSPVAALEARRMKVFGYIDSDAPRPLIRLACQAQAYGRVTIVIPPWNGMVGKFLRQQRRAGQMVEQETG